MAAHTDDVLRKTRGRPSKVTIAITTSNTTYRGSLVTRIKTTGRVSDGTAATGRRFFGHVVDLVGPNGPGTGTGVGNAAGTEKAVIEYGNEAYITVATAIRTNTSLGLNVFLGANNQVAGTAVGTAAKRLAVGELVEWAETNKSAGWVAIRVFAKTDIAV